MRACKKCGGTKFQTVAFVPLWCDFSMGDDMVSFNTGYRVDNLANTSVKRLAADIVCKKCGEKIVAITTDPLWRLNFMDNTVEYQPPPKEEYHTPPQIKRGKKK